MVKLSPLSALLLLLATHLTPSNAWTGRTQPSSLAQSRVKNPNTKQILPNAPSSKRDDLTERLRSRGGGGEQALEMSAVNTIHPLVTTLVPQIGILTSTILYFSPFAAVRRASISENLGDLNPVPLAVMAVSSICWLVYGLSVQNPYVTLSNVPGSIASIWYITTVLPLLRGKSLRNTQAIVVGLAAMTIHLWTWLSLSHKSMVHIQSALGSFASALFIILSVSPLSTIGTVFRTRDSGSILAPLTFAQVTNTALWSAYGLAIKDKFVWGPNAVGLGFGLIQLALKILFPSRK